MDPKELRGLYEAYSEVYAPKEEEIEEEMKPLPKEKMARQAQRAQGMENRAAAAGDEKETNRQMQRRLAMQMPSSRRTVLDKKKMGEEVEIEEAVKGESSERRKDLAAERRAGHKPKSAKEGENYASHKLSQMAYVQRKRMGEEVEIFDVVLEFLQVEGYAETLEEAEWLMANVIDEEAIDIILGEEQLDEVSKTDDTTRSLIKQYAGKKGISFEPGPRWDPSANRGKGANLSPKQVEKQRRKKLRAEDYVNEAITSEKGKAKAAEMIAARSTPSGRAKSGKGANVAQIRQIRGSGRGSFDREGLGGTPMTPTMAKNPIKKQNYIGTGNKAARRAGTYQEQFELWVNSLVEEGYNLSGYTWDEMYEIYLDEAQEARNNPEKYEAGEKKKYAPVRGEKTPMPPRGDKRREDFEKWYAANVR